MDQGAVTLRMHPALTRTLNALLSTPLGESFKDRVEQVAVLKPLEDEIDKAEALAAYMWVIENADSGGLPLTAAGYLKPAYVKSLAAVLPTMRDWPFNIGREIDVQPVLYFREELQTIGLLRKYKASLRASRLARAMLNHPDWLWSHIARVLIPAEGSFHEAATVVLLVHLASTDGEIDHDAVARTLTTLGWGFSDGTPVTRADTIEELADLWTLLGNVSEPASEEQHDAFLTRVATPAVRLMIHSALFEEV